MEPTTFEWTVNWNALLSGGIAGLTFLIGRWYEARRWRKAADSMTYAAPAQEQSVVSQGREYFVLYPHQYRQLSQR